MTSTYKQYQSEDKLLERTPTSPAVSVPPALGLPPLLLVFPQQIPLGPAAIG